MYANDSCHFMAARPWFTERPLLPCQLDWRQAFSCKLWAGCANQKWCDCYFQSPSFSFMLQCHWRSEKGERFISSFHWSTCWFSKSMKGEPSNRSLTWQQNGGQRREWMCKRKKDIGGQSREGQRWSVDLLCHVYNYWDTCFLRPPPHTKAVTFHAWPASVSWNRLSFAAIVHLFCHCCN